ALMLTLTTMPAAPKETRSPAQQIFELVNQIRSDHNLRPLKVSPELSKSAQGYAAQMGKENFFGHTSPNGSTCVSRDCAAGYTDWKALAENLAAGYESPKEVVDAWMKSPGHRKNMLAPDVKETGIGYALVPGSHYETYWVQEFGTRKARVARTGENEAAD
ncbi:MAG TPA: CAP domain-containing protein, partial [Chloroflexota bacterium]|nr:CAP domain-containing protein [Chloroflexota bacterium]